LNCLFQFTAYGYSFGIFNLFLITSNREHNNYCTNYMHIYIRGAVMAVIVW